MPIFVKRKMPTNKLSDFVVAGIGFTPVKDILGKKIVIVGFEMDNGKFGAFAKIELKDGTIIGCGGNAVLQTLEELKKKKAFPVACRFEQVKSKKGNRKYYRLTD